jgi:hypothetical protein
MLEALGLERRMRNVSPSLREYIDEKMEAAE